MKGKKEKKRKERLRKGVRGRKKSLDRGRGDLLV